MATGQLVPHQLPDGRIAMVPDYLLPPQAPQPALALPNVPAPPAAPDQRLAAIDTGAVAPPDPGLIAEWNKRDAEQKQIADMRAALTAGAPPEHPRPPDRVAELERLGNKPAGGGKVDPSTLATGGRPSPQGSQQDSGGGMDPIVRQVFNEGPRGGGGGRNPGLVVGSIKEEREPGRQLLPEQLWALGVEQRPDFGEEIDPDALPYRNRKTLELEPPKMRKVLTPIERGAEQQGQFARTQFEQQEQARRDFGITQRAALAQESQAIDENLAAIAERRKRIAELHDVADRRMAEAESQEPRTRGEIWESKGNLARGTAILAAVLSGAAAGLQGKTGSPAWEQIEASMDDAVNDERYKAERRMKLGLEAKNDWERAMALYGDQDIANLEAKQRKRVNMLATAQQMLSDRALDATAKMRGEQVYTAGKAAFLQGQYQLMDMLTGHSIKQEINYKPGATGGGAGLDTLARLERAARAKKALNVVTGEDGNKPERAITEATTDAIGGALDTVIAARGVKTRLQALKVDQDDLDDPRSGAYDYVTKNIPGTETRRIGQDLDQDTEQLARGAQQFLGKSDNDAALAERAAKGLGGSGRERFQSATRLERKAINRIKLAVTSMTPDQRNAWFKALPPDQRQVVEEAIGTNTSPAKIAPSFKPE